MKQSFMSTHRSGAFAPLLLRTCIGFALAVAIPSFGQESLEIKSPTPYQVVQRIGFVPQEAHPHALGGPALGYADVTVAWKSPLSESARYRAKVSRLGSNAGIIVEREIAVSVADAGMAKGTIRLPAGGWYRLELEGSDGPKTARGVVEPVGVGEVFLIAGQSYATNTNEEKLVVHDPEGRVAAWNFSNNHWRKGDDPQPTPDGSDGGSIWPAVGDHLATVFQVPIGFANVAWGGTSSAQWLPEGDLHPRLVAAGQTLGRFRAVLWQQGESDVIGKTTIERYVENLVRIRESAVQAWGWGPRWLLAKSTLHPTVYDDPSGESRIRHALEQLAHLPGFGLGPDTDLLDASRRGPMNSRRHFSAEGQKQAALLWFHSLASELERRRPEYEIALSSLPDLHLGDFVWSSPIIYRETSVLLADDSGKVTARLAFPASEILSVRAANGSHEYRVGEEVSLMGDGVTLSVSRAGPVPVIRPTDLYPPIDQPGSFKHRLGHPEQGMLYAPGRGFHDRDIEITYRRASGEVMPGAPAFAASELPKTLRRLKAGRPIRILVMGDSISFGWDSSRLGEAPPYQFAYPTLVAAALHESFGSEIDLVNRAVSGWSIEHGVGDLSPSLATKPDLIFVAFGMNDVGRKDPTWFGEQAKKIVERVQTDLPESEIILVSSMIANREWVHTPVEMFPLYRDELARLKMPGVALADVTRVWQGVLARKHDLDLTGNGLNHPNDFGHRLYAQTILSLLAGR